MKTIGDGYFETFELIQKLQMIFRMKTIEDVRKKLQEINEHIKKEQNSLKFQYRIGQRDVLKWVLEE